MVVCCFRMVAGANTVVVLPCNASLDISENNASTAFVLENCTYGFVTLTLQNRSMNTDILIRNVSGIAVDVRSSNVVLVIQDVLNDQASKPMVLVQCDATLPTCILQNVTIVIRHSAHNTSSQQTNANCVRIGDSTEPNNLGTTVGFTLDVSNTTAFGGSCAIQSFFTAYSMSINVSASNLFRLSNITGNYTYTAHLYLKCVLVNVMVTMSDSILGYVTYREGTVTSVSLSQNSTNATILFTNITWNLEHTQLGKYVKVLSIDGMLADSLIVDVRNSTIFGKLAATGSFRFLELESNMTSNTSVAIGGVSYIPQSASVLQGKLVFTDFHNLSDVSIWISDVELGVGTWTVVQIQSSLSTRVGVTVSHLNLSAQSGQTRVVLCLSPFVNQFRVNINDVSVSGPGKAAELFGVLVSQANCVGATNIHVSSLTGMADLSVGIFVSGTTLGGNINMSVFNANYSLRSSLTYDLRISSSAAASSSISLLGSRCQLEMSDTSHSDVVIATNLLVIFTCTIRNVSITVGTPSLLSSSALVVACVGVQWATHAKGLPLIVIPFTSAITSLTVGVTSLSILPFSASTGCQSPLLDVSGQSNVNNSGSVATSINLIDVNATSCLAAPLAMLGNVTLLRLTPSLIYGNLSVELRASNLLVPTYSLLRATSSITGASILFDLSNILVSSASNWSAIDIQESFGVFNMNVTLDRVNLTGLLPLLTLNSGGNTTANIVVRCSLWRQDLSSQWTPLTQQHFGTLSATIDSCTGLLGSASATTILTSSFDRSTTIHRSKSITVTSLLTPTSPKDMDSATVTLTYSPKEQDVVYAAAPLIEAVSTSATAATALVGALVGSSSVASDAMVLVSLSLIGCRSKETSQQQQPSTTSNTPGRFLLSPLFDEGALIMTIGNIGIGVGLMGLQFVALLVYGKPCIPPTQKDVHIATTTYDVAAAVVRFPSIAHGFIIILLSGVAWGAPTLINGTSDGDGTTGVVIGVLALVVLLGYGVASTKYVWESHLLHEATKLQQLYGHPTVAHRVASALLPRFRWGPEPLERSYGPWISGFNNIPSSWGWYCFTMYYGVVFTLLSAIPFVDADNACWAQYLLLMIAAAVSGGLIAWNRLALYRNSISNELLLLSRILTFAILALLWAEIGEGVAELELAQSIVSLVHSVYTMILRILQLLVTPSHLGAVATGAVGGEGTRRTWNEAMWRGGQLALPRAVVVDGTANSNTEQQYQRPDNIPVQVRRSLRGLISNICNQAIHRSTVERMASMIEERRSKTSTL